MRSVRPAVLVLLFGLTLLACSPSSSAPGTPTAQPDASHVPIGYDAIGCQPIDLRGPTGEPIDLTGLWGQPGQDLRFRILQLDDCVFMSDVPRGADDLGWICDGKVTAEFRITGHCVELVTGEFEVWEPALSFSDEGEVIFQQTCGNAGPGFDCGPPTVRLDSDATPVPTPT